MKDLASLRRGHSKEDLDVRRLNLLKTAALHPLPPKSDLKGMVTGTIQREGYRIEKVRYESRPGLLVTAHLYLPEGQGPWPLIVSSHGTWKGKKAAPVSQARGISFALRGFATLIVDAPGSFGEDLSVDERGQLGAPAEPDFIMGAPWLGQYAWDLIRGVDLCVGRPDIDPQRVGVTGEGDGGIASLIAFIAEARFSCTALVCTAPSMEQKSLESILQLGLPGLTIAGDFSDLLAIRTTAPVFLIASAGDDRFTPEDISRTAEKLGKGVRFEQFVGGHDYSRRMRESVAAFFNEHLLAQSPLPYLPELRPLTDGAQNPYPAGTAEPASPELQVTDWQSRHSLTLKDVLKTNMAEPHPDPFHVEDRLAPWPKYGQMPKLDTAITLGLHDTPTVLVPKATPSIGLPVDLVDTRMAVLGGLSLPEFFAQVLHLGLPGRPETWEAKALTGDGLSAIIASMKTLVQSATIETIPTKIVAEGPIASATAMFLCLYRPSLQIETSHTWTNWQDMAAVPQNIQPLARYLEWPFGN